jgi:glutathione S-transferase P
MTKPVLNYFPLRGRGEVIRLILHYKNIEYDEVVTDYAAMKANKDDFPFGQVPHFTDSNGFGLVQSNAIIRHLARTYNLYGASNVEHAQVDVVLDSVEDMRQKYIRLIYQDRLSDAGKEEYARNLPAVLEPFEHLLTKNGGRSFVGSSLTVADFAVFDILDLHMRIMPDIIAQFPALSALHQAIAADPNVAAYLKSDKRQSKINGNSLG